MATRCYMAIRRVASIALLLAAPLTLAIEEPPPDADRNVLEVFVRDGCPHCDKAKSFLRKFSSQRPALRIIVRTVNRNANVRDDLMRHSRNAGIWPPGVPTFVIGGQILVGFDDAQRTGSQLAALVDQLEAPSRNVETELFGTLSVSRLGLPLFTLALGLLDGFNPCAMWVLLILLSLLVHLHDRKRMALVAGTFVLVSGAVYFAFMAAWLNILLLVGLTTLVHRLLAGVALVIGALSVKDFLRPGRELSLAIPAAAKPGLYARLRTILAADSLLPALSAVAVLAVVVNFIELLCTAGLPAIYTAILTQQDLSLPAHYGYLGLYILAYIADDALMVTLAVFALSSQKLSASTGRWLKLVSGGVMLLLGAIMLLRPEWLL